ncbi:MAG: metal ABC transporter substrate-binding protein [Chloroflexi bacterium]|nr:metal ABC transporter substrate-binding protein [Chloroflexota bacterium]
MKIGKTILAHLGLMMGLIWLAACSSGAAATPSGQGQTPAESQADEKLKGVATFSILGDLVQNVGGDKIELHTLVGPGGDTHTFEPSPNDGVALVEAKLIFENGLGLETWLDDLYTASGSQAQRVVVTEGLEPIAMAEGGHEEHVEHDEHAAEAESEEHNEHAAEAEHEEHAEADGHGHAHGEFDPHVWHDVTNVIHEVEAIRDALTEADPANAKSYQANAEAYLGQLKELDDWATEEVKKLPEDRRKLVTSHDTFGYFAKRYGFEVVGSGLGSTTEASDPSAAEMVSLVEEIKGAGVPAIFTENVSNPKLMERIAAEAGVTLGPELYTDALGQPGSDGDTYLKMMRYNVTTLVMALSK